MARHAGEESGGPERRDAAPEQLQGERIQREHRRNAEDHGGQTQRQQSGIGDTRNGIEQEIVDGRPVVVERDAQQLAPVRCVDVPERPHLVVPRRPVQQRVDAQDQRHNDNDAQQDPGGTRGWLRRSAMGHRRSPAPHHAGYGQRQRSCQRRHRREPDDPHYLEECSAHQHGEQYARRAGHMCVQLHRFSLHGGGARRPCRRRVHAHHTRSARAARTGQDAVVRTTSVGARSCPARQRLRNGRSRSGAFRLFETARGSDAAARRSSGSLGAAGVIQPMGRGCGRRGCGPHDVCRPRPTSGEVGVRKADG